MEEWVIAASDAEANASASAREDAMLYVHAMRGSECVTESAR